MLARLLGVTDHARDEDITRAISSAGVILLDGLIRVVTLDGHRMAIVEAASPDVTTAADPLMIPAGVVEPLRALLVAAGDAPVTVAREESFVGVRCGGTTMIFAEGPPGLPPYQQLVEMNQPSSRAVVARAELAAAIKAVAVASDRSKAESHRIGLAFAPGVIKVTARDKRDAEAFDEIVAHVDGPESTAFLNGSYVSDALAAIETADVIVEYSADDKASMLGPLFFRPTDGKDLFVVMPQR
jgi:DNA polymerase-3 subunit beta